MSLKIYERSDDIKVYRGSHLDKEEWDSNVKLEGYVRTQDGFVVVCQYADEDETESFFNMDFIYKGREYHKQITGKSFTVRGIVMQSRKFAKEIVRAH